MKTLVTLSFALDLDEEHLVEFVQMIDESIFQGIKARLAETPIPEGCTREDFEQLIDFYGASFTPRRPMLEGIIE